jgi:8-oxo-dGTP pyrophosphatase MutT (NUDIX family)
MTVLASGIIVFRPRALHMGPRLLLLRNLSDGAWGLPKGRRQPGDAHELVTAHRELAEETGYTGLTLVADFRCTLDYIVRGVEDHGRLKRVVYFLAEAPAREPVLSTEHDHMLWADEDEWRRRLAHPFLRDLARHALDAVLRLEPGEPSGAPQPTPAG